MRSDHVHCNWQALFTGLERSGIGLKAQIRKTLVQAIERRVLLPGARLPSGRHLASMLSVARITVTEVYQDLVGSGYLMARERSGIFVAQPHEAYATPTAPISRATVDQWQSRFAIDLRQGANFHKPNDWRRYRYPFLLGALDPRLFPTAEWRRAVQEASSGRAMQDWSADMIDGDDPALIEQLCLQVLPRRSIWAAPEEVMITLGTQQALYLIMRLFLRAGSVVGLQEPGYADVRRVVALADARIAPMHADESGGLPNDRLSECDMMLLTPGHDHASPDLKTIERRQAFIKAAQEAGTILVEADYDADLFLEGTKAPPLRACDTERNVIYVGGFSKIMSPGLRLGFVVAPPPVIDGLRALRRLMTRHPPTNNQRAMACFIAQGHYRGHLRRLGEALVVRAQLMDSLLSSLFPDCSWQRGQGTASVWMRGPEGLDSTRLAHIARERSVLLEPGTIFFSQPAHGARYFRLGFSSIPTERIEPGLQAVRAALDECVGLSIGRRVKTDLALFNIPRNGLPAEPFLSAKEPV